MVRIEDVLSRLQGVIRKGGGQYLAQCPCHDDKKASLALREGDKGIVLHCLAGCDTQDIVAKLGLGMQDLFSEGSQGSKAKAPGKGAQGKGQGAAAKAQEGAAEKPRVRKKAEAFRVGGVFVRIEKGDKGEIVRHPEDITHVYEYTDAAGAPLLQVARTREKSFPVVHFFEGAWYWGDGGLTAALYRLPRVKEGIEKKQRIFLVEGEKDVEALEQLGLYATTNKGGAGKWKKEVSEDLKGAKVVIIPDLDEPGRRHGRMVAKDLEGHAREVRVLNLKKLEASLPDKGDVSDLISIKGPEEALALLLEGVKRALVMSRKVDDSDYAEYYEGLRGFGVQNGAICQWKNDAWSPLCNFTALPIEEVARDDGATGVSTVFKIIGWAGDGRRLPEVSVTAEAFGGMNWPLKSWGLCATIRSGNGIKERLREAIQTAGDRCAIRKTCYTHTGWRTIDGRLVYLHGGGAIGAEDVVVELDYGFNRYDLTGVVAGPAAKMERDKRLEYCAAQTLMCLNVAGPRVGVPLVGYMFLTPLRHFLMQRGRRPSFIPFVRGRTGSGKSVMASLVLNHFGRDFSYDTAHPASFDDTVNGISLKLFALKDMPLLIDDYHPEENPLRRRAMEDVAQRVSRMIGDGARRSRMRNDTTGQEDKPARALCIQTGEDLPRVTESGVARMYVIDLDRGDVPLGGDVLTDLQQAAREGCLSETMRRYVEWLLDRADTLPDQLDARYGELLREALQRVEGAHARIPPVVAYLMLGLETMLDFMADNGIFPAADVPGMLENMWEAVLENTRKQVLEMKDDKPTRLFCDTLRELVDSGKVIIEDIARRWESHQGVIGCKDNSYYYLNPGQAYGAVQKALNEQGTSFPIGKNMLLKQLADEGLIIRDPGTGKNVKQLNKGGVRAWVMWMPKAVLDRVEQGVMAEVQERRSRDGWTA